jgi:peptide/nickel transport system ATP-binding protein
MTTLLEVEGLSKSYPVRSGLFGPARLLDALVDIDLTVETRETLAVVGESGCGKTTLGRCIVRAQSVGRGHIVYHPPGGAAVDLAHLPNRALKPWRREIRMIFQDPMSSLNPCMTVFDIVAEPLRIHRLASGGELDDRVVDILSKVGLGADALHRYPHAFSGGQRQRVGIARALVLKPRLVVADEAVSALDVSIQAQILNLLEDLKRDFGLTYIFISHDLGIVNHIADRIVVMYLGQVVEVSPTDRLFAQPRHPYTELLLGSLPTPDPTRRAAQRVQAKGEIPALGERPAGCPFETRCRYADERCRRERPRLRPIDGGPGLVACHYAEGLALAGAYQPASQAH